jgi:hypothetical protein
VAAGIVAAATTSFAGMAPTAPRVRGFIANQGQWPQDVLFLPQDRGLNTWITADGIIVDRFSVRTESDARVGQVVQATWTNAQRGSVVETSAASGTTVRFFVGNDPAAWTRSCAVAARVTVRGVYPGVDVVYYEDADGRLRYDLHAEPGADVSRIGMTFAGADAVHVDAGKVRLSTVLGDVVMTDLAVFENSRQGARIAATFSPNGQGFAFSISGHDPTRPLIIDPLVYGTYVGDPSYDKTVGVRYLPNGVVVGGTTAGISFPAGTGRYQSSVASDLDAFVAVLSPDLEEVIAYTYFGGGGVDRMSAMTTDATGAVYMTGQTTSSNLPVSSGAAGQIYRGQIDGFVVKLSNGLTKLDVCTYLGGNRDDIPNAIAVDASQNIFIAGGTNSTTGFPTTLAHQGTNGGQWDGFLSRLSPNGSSFGFSTYFGKEGIETFTALALNSGGEPFVTGSTTSSNFETAPTPGRWSSGRVPYDRTFNGGTTDAFVVKFFSDGTLSKRDDGTYSTFFGGNGEDVGRGIFVDQTGRAIVVGTTTSTNLPTTGAAIAQPIGQRDIFMAVLADDGRALASCTYYGGTGNDDILGAVNLNATSTGVIFGTTTSNDYPSIGAGANADRLGVSDGFITTINTAAAIQSTVIGGLGADSVVAVAVDPNGDYYYALASNSTDLFVSDSVFRSEAPGQEDGYVGKYAAGTLALQAPIGGEQWCIGTNNTVSWGAEEMLNGERYNVEMSADGGETWTFLARDLTSRSFAWRPDTALTPTSAYRIRVTTNRGHLSSSANFALADPPSIQGQPADTSVCADARVELSVVAVGTGMKYQWRRNGQNIPGATSATYAIASVNASTAGKYDVVVSGSCNPSATSRQATVGVSAATAITAQPADQTVEEGKALRLSVTATGSNLRYQWSKDGSAITGATTNEYAVSAARLADGGTYSCTVTGGCGTVSSTEVTVVVTPSTSVDEDVHGGMGVAIVGPNPAVDHVTLRIGSNEPSDVIVRIIDGQGRIVATQPIGLVRTEVDVQVGLDACASGVYVLECTFGRSVRRVPITIAR